MPKKNSDKYKFIHICYFSCLPYIDKDKYFKTLNFYVNLPEDKISKNLLKEFKLFWNIIKNYLKSLRDKKINISFKSIVLRTDKDDFKDKMRFLYKSLENLSKKLNLTWWQSKSFIAFVIWREEYSLTDLFQIVHSYCEKKTKEKLEFKKLIKGDLKD